MNHTAANNTTPSSTGGGAPATTPSDASDEKRPARTHRSSTDEAHPPSAGPKTPAQPVAPVKPAPIKASTAKAILTTPIKASPATGTRKTASPPISSLLCRLFIAVSHSTPNNSSPSSGSGVSNHVLTPTTPQVNGALGKPKPLGKTFSFQTNSNRVCNKFRLFLLFSLLGGDGRCAGQFQ